MNDNVVARWLSELNIDGMYDAPGYLKPWYFMLRVFEEITRSKRYERAVTIMSIRVELDGIPTLEDWLSTRLRATDLLCRDATAQYFVLLPETTEDSASDIARRLSTQVGGASVMLASLPAEVDRFAELVDWIVVDSSRKAA
jgi:hypothetical protein